MIITVGKIAMDVDLWLINVGVNPDATSWVMPRDFWLVNRLHIQLGAEFLREAIGGKTDQIDALAKATSIDDLRCKPPVKKELCSR